MPIWARAFKYVYLFFFPSEKRVAELSNKLCILSLCSVFVSINACVKLEMSHCSSHGALLQSIISVISLVSPCNEVVLSFCLFPTNGSMVVGVLHLCAQFHVDWDVQRKSAWIHAYGHFDTSDFYFIFFFFCVREFLDSSVRHPSVGNLLSCSTWGSRSLSIGCTDNIICCHNLFFLL